MAKKYSLKKLLVDTQLDDIGLKKSLVRFENESMSSYRNRIVKSAKNPPKSNTKYYNLSTNNFLNTNSSCCFRIHLVDSELDPKDLPRVVIDSNSLKVWKHRSKDPVVSINLKDKKFKFLKNVKEVLESLTFLEIEILDYDEYLLSEYLLQVDSTEYVAKNVEPDSKVIRLDEKYIVEFLLGNGFAALVEKDSFEALSVPGDYYIDRLNGIVYTYSINNGFGDVVFENFPLNINFGEAKIFIINEESFQDLMYDKQVNEQGYEENLELNNYGAYVVNQILIDNRIYWGR